MLLQLQAISFVLGGTRYSSIFVICAVFITSCNAIESACQCSTVNTDQAFIACDLLADTIDTDQLRTQETCFQASVQFCSGALGLPAPALEGLWVIGQRNQPVGPGESALQAFSRTRAVNCTGPTRIITFNQQMADSSDAFTFLKTIQAGDTLQLTRIVPTSCGVIEAVTTCAAASTTGCGSAFTVSVFDAFGLSGLYGAIGEYVSVLNFGQKPARILQNDCAACYFPARADILCWPALICSGLMDGFIPVECLDQPGASQRIVLNSGNLSAVTVLAIPKATSDGASVVDLLCAMRMGDRLRVYAPGVANQTSLNTPPGQLDWATLPVNPFGVVGSLGDIANGIAIDLDGNSILAGSHGSSGVSERQFAALQLISNGTAVQLGWATALFTPFGASDDPGDTAQGVAIDLDGAIILAGAHSPLGTGPSRFSALQLIPNMSGGVDLGWATAPFQPFGAVGFDRANAVAIADDGSIILVGRHQTTGTINQFAALKLIPVAPTAVQLGWATALVAPFGPVEGFALGDTANAVAIDGKGNIILAGLHEPSEAEAARFAALQLIPIGTSVQLGWVTSPLVPFGAPADSGGDRAFGLAIDCNENIILAGLHSPSGGEPQMAALQLVPDGTGVTLGWATALTEPFGPVGRRGDQARDVVIDDNNTIILGGFHGIPPSFGREFAALQLVPNASVTVDLGWTASLSSPFMGEANGAAIGLENNVVLAGFYVPASVGVRYAALQLRQPLVPAYGDYEITSIKEVDDFIIFGLALLNSESSTVCPGQELCIKAFGSCCV